MGRMKRPGRVAVGVRVRFEGRIRGVLAVAAQAVTLTDGEEPYRVVPLLELFAAADFEVVNSPVRMPLPAASLLEAFPAREVERALWWEGHILEVLHGLPPEAGPGTAVRPEYGPERSLTARQRAKAAELTAAGHKVSASTVAHRRRRYQERGVPGLADHRPVRRTAEFGEVADAVVAAMRQAIEEAVDASTRTGTFILWRTGEILEEAPDMQGAGLPSQRTLYRLLAKLTPGTHTSGSAVTRRSRAHGATTPHGELPVFAPGEVMQIDSTPLDVLVLLDNGVTGRVELTAMIDVATRTLTAAVLRPTTKAVDASVLPARTVTPELMRPGWTDALRMSRSVLPHRRLLALDERKRLPRAPEQKAPCRECGKSMKIQPGQRYRLCSSACRRANYLKHEEEWLAEADPADPSGPRICPVCDGPMFSAARRTCSDRCRQRARRQQLRPPPANPPSPPPTPQPAPPPQPPEPAHTASTRPCETCGGPLPAGPCQQQRRTCSQRCRQKAYRQRKAQQPSRLAR
ncbi:hypothetical protein [Streptomyces sp. NPDC016845]|uniref:hypothetical protein n=1 Tax=Streptomyces sp. NPDC016845 TaxID=3364972 RepID=UPI0037BCDC24